MFKIPLEASTQAKKFPQERVKNMADEPTKKHVYLKATEAGEKATEKLFEKPIKEGAKEFAKEAMEEYAKEGSK